MPQPMKGQNPLKDLTQEALILATAADEPRSGGGLPPELLQLISRRYQKELEEDERKEEELRRLKESQIEYTKQAMAQKEAMQNACPHIKENGRPRLGGQRLSSGEIVFICQNCHKTWTNSPPPHLMVSLEAIGG